MKLYKMECIYDPETAQNPFSPGMLGQEFYIQSLDGELEVGDTYEDADNLIWRRIN